MTALTPDILPVEEETEEKAKIPSKRETFISQFWQVSKANKETAK